MRITYTMRTIAKSFALLVPIVLSLLLFACTDGGAGIFYSIEIEEPISNNKLPDFLSSQSAVQIGTDYYFGAMQLYRGSETQILNGNDLDKVSLPDGWRYTMQIASDGSDLYAIMENLEGDSTAFYYYDGSWHKSASSFTGRPYKVWFENSTIYVATVSTEDRENKRYSYRLYGDADPNALVAVSLPYTPSNPIVDVAHHTAENLTFVITPADCFSGTGTTINTVVGSAPSDLFKRSLYYSAHNGGTLFMATSNAPLNGDGAVYKWDDVGDSWVSFDSSVGTDPNGFGDVFDGSNWYLLLGTQSGYQEMIHGGSGFGSESATIDSDNYENKELESAAVQGFIDGPGETFFALTASNGIWQNSEGSWDLE